MAKTAKKSKLPSKKPPKKGAVVAKPKPAPKRPAVKPPVKVAPKPVAAPKSVTKADTKPVVKAPVVKAPVVKAPVVKAPAVKAPAVKAPVMKAPAKPEVVAAPPAIEAVDAAALNGAATKDRPKPKGITIVTPKPMKKPKIKKPLVMPLLGQPLLKPGAKRPKPLIASGPNAPSLDRMGTGPSTGEKKTHLPKKELERYRGVLLRKRAELIGDVSSMENEALRGGNSGSLSHLPQHMADQGSDAYEQALSLDLAQVDRNLVREIDEALARIEAGSFGVCMLTGKPISKERLDELPWTRFTIEAARERERRSFRP